MSIEMKNINSLKPSPEQRENILNGKRLKEKTVSRYKGLSFKASPESFCLPFNAKATVKVVLENKNQRAIYFTVDSTNSRTLTVEPRTGFLFSGEIAHIIVRRPKQLPGINIRENLIFKITPCNFHNNKSKYAKRSPIYRKSKNNLITTDDPLMYDKNQIKDFKTKQLQHHKGIFEDPDDDQSNKYHRSSKPQFELSQMYSSLIYDGAEVYVTKSCVSDHEVYGTKNGVSDSEKIYVTKRGVLEQEKVRITKDGVSDHEKVYIRKNGISDPKVQRKNAYRGKSDDFSGKIGHYPNESCDPSISMDSFRVKDRIYNDLQALESNEKIHQSYMKVNYRNKQALPMSSKPNMRHFKTENSEAQKHHALEKLIEPHVEQKQSIFVNSVNSLKRCAITALRSIKSRIEDPNSDLRIPTWLLYIVIAFLISISTLVIYVLFPSIFYERRKEISVWEKCISFLKHVSNFIIYLWKGSLDIINGYDKKEESLWEKYVRFYK